AMNLRDPNTPDELTCAHWEPSQVQVVLMVLFDGSPATTTSTLRAWSKAITGWTLDARPVGSVGQINQFEPLNSNARVPGLGGVFWFAKVITCPRNGTKQAACVVPNGTPPCCVHASPS